MTAGAGWETAILHAWTEADQALWAGVLNFGSLGACLTGAFVTGVPKTTIGVGQALRRDSTALPRPILDARGSVHLPSGLLDDWRMAIYADRRRRCSLDRSRGLSGARPEAAFAATLRITARCLLVGGDSWRRLWIFTFNLGAGRLQTSLLRRRINRQDWPGRSTRVAALDHGGGRVPGLVTRRDAEARLLG